MSAAVVPTPRRGGIHPVYGVFLGGSAMKDDYRLSSPDFHCVSQLRSIKQLQIIQNTLEQARNSLTSIKFHGNVEIDDAKATTELDKNHFVKKVEQLVETYGFQGFFYMKAMDGSMVSLLSHSHLFTLKDVLTEHANRLAPHVPITDESGVEMASSVITQYSKYDSYDKLDCRISRLAIESIIGSSLQEDIKTRYSHLNDFHALPGSVYFMMALEASNASVSLDIDDATEKFSSLSLTSYPGENIKKLAIEALRLIKIMEGGYCLPLRLGSDLLRKVSSTSCEHFNRWICAKLDEVRDLEMLYKLKDPKLMMSDPKYGSLGPVALCGFLQEKYGSLITEKAWPALAATLPVSNHTPIPDATPKAKTRHCYYCKSPDHVKNECLKLAAKRKKEAEEASNEGSPPVAPSPSPSPAASMAAWRYIRPADPSQAVEIDGVTYKWCQECRCRATGKQGYFTCTHFTAEHVRRNVSFPSPAANHSSIVPVIPDDGAFLPASIPPEERLVFTGPWHCEVEVEVSEVDSHVSTGEIVVPFESDAACVLGAFYPTANVTEIPNVSVIDGVESITFTNDENEASSPATATVILPGLDAAESVVDVDSPLVSDVPVATPILSSVPSSSLLLLSRTNHLHVFDTCPLLSVVDMEFCELCPCDNSPCLSVGPEGFSCALCPNGIYHTALVRCSGCFSGHGFLGDPCPHCGHPLYGRIIIQSGLPGQSLSDFTDVDDPDSAPSRNLARSSAYFTGFDFLPSTSINWAAVPVRSFPTAPGASQEVEEVAMHDYPCMTDVFHDASELPDVFHDASESLDDDNVLFDAVVPDVAVVSDVAVVPDVPVASVPVFSPLYYLLSWSWSLICVLGRWLYTALCVSFHAVGQSFGSVILGSISVLSSLSVSLNYWCFVIGTVFWDTLDLLMCSPRCRPPGTRRLLRSRSPRARFFPRHWMLLSSLMLLSGFSSISAFSATVSPLLRTYRTCHRIAQLVHMSPLVVYDLHRSRMRALFAATIHQERAIAPTCQDLHPQPKNGSQKKAVDPEEPMYADACETLPSLDLLDLDTLTSEDILEFDCTESGPLQHANPTAPRLNAALAGTNLLNLDVSPLQRRFPVIFDSGASIAITDKTDFVGPLQAPPAGLTIGGMARGAKVEGIGLVKWKFKTPTGAMILSVTCYFVPACSARLLSPQRLFNKKKGLVGSFSIEEDHAALVINDNPPFIIEYENTTFLPVGLAWNATQTTTLLQPSANLCVTNETNQNLTPSQKLLMTWHYRFGHRNLPFVQHLLRLPVFAGEKFQSASRAELPKCEICEYAKAHARSTAGNRQTPNPVTDGALKDGQLRPGNKVSADHFESRLKGRTYSSYGKTTSDQYVGGCIFVDHMSGYIHVEHKLGFSSSETIRAKQNFEQSALGHGVLVEDYLTDNGIFSKTQFVEHIRQHNQQIHYCGVNAHHKNAVAERAIRTVSELACALLLHASIHWPGGIEGTLWPMAVDHAVHLYNTLPNQHGICPLDLFSGTTVPRHKLRDLHVWGCPVYVLDPVLQQGKKLPRWQPHSRRGVFLGYSRHHSSDVPLVLNLQTGSISPQFHIVFDDSFSTVTSVATDSDPPDFWTAHNIESCLHKIPVEVDDTSASLLPDDWLTPGELEEKRRHEHRRSRIRPTFVSDVPVPAPLPVAVEASPSSAPPSDPPSLADASNVPSGLPPPVVAPSRSPEAAEAAVPPSSLPVPSASSPSDDPPSSGLCRSARSNKGVFSSTKYVDEVYHSAFTSDGTTRHDRELSYHTDLHTDLDTGDLNHFDPHAFVAKAKKHDPDNPTYTEAMSGDDQQHYVDAMMKEIMALLEQRTWTRVHRSEVPHGHKILKGTWAFKLKRLPDGTPLKYKARYCCRGDMQTEGIDYFDTYAPVVQWSTVRLVLTLTLKNGWSTRQVDYTNAFAQADLQEEVYIEPPRGFSGLDGYDKVLRLRKSLYGLKQAPKTFFKKLRAGLIERGFTQSGIDPCLFMKKEMICVIYVDDTILCGPDINALEAEIKGLGVNNLEQ